MDPCYRTEQGDQQETLQGDQLNQEVIMTEELAAELLELLQSPNIQVKHGTFSAILQYTQSESNKKLLIGSSLFRLLLKNLFVPQLTTICLSTMISFSSSKMFQNQWSQFIEPIMLQLGQWSSLQVQMSLLFLLNASKSEEVVAQIINKQVKRGYLVFLLLNFISKVQKPWIILSILVNITSVQSGRTYIAQECIHLKLLFYLQSDNQTTRCSVLKIIRNCAFLWQNQDIIAKTLSSEYHLIDQLAKHMVLLIFAGKLDGNTHHVESLLQKYCPDSQTITKRCKELRGDNKQQLSELEMSIDIILILSNSNFPQRKPDIRKDELKQLISLLKFTKIEQATKDKLEALEIFMFW